MIHAALRSPLLAGAARDGLAGLAGLAHAMLYGTLGVLFGLSLRPGRVALGAALALRVEPCPTADLLAYARCVTWLWTGFCVVQLAGSALLAACAPLWLWSAWINLVEAPLVVTLFLLEYAVRRRRFRGRPMATLRQCIGVTVANFARKPA